MVHFADASLAYATVMGARRTIHLTPDTHRPVVVTVVLLGQQLLRTGIQAVRRLRNHSRIGDRGLEVGPNQKGEDQLKYADTDGYSP